MRALSIVARAVSPTRAATSTRFAAATIHKPYRRCQKYFNGKQFGMGRTVRARQLRTSEPRMPWWPRSAEVLIAGMEDEMVAYWVARSKVNNPDQYKKYTDRVPGILQTFGGKILARGGKYKILEGPEKFHRFIVIEFPSLEKAVACHESPQYLEAAAHRRKDGASELEIVSVESILDPAIRPFQPAGQHTK